MKNRKRIRDIMIGILIGCILTTTTPVLANSIRQTIDVRLNTVKVEVNGERLNVDNILYQGTTYLPMRAVAEAVGKDIRWEQETMTASIIEKQILGNNKKIEGDVLNDDKYREFNNMFTIINSTDTNNNRRFKYLEYNGDLTLEELKEYLNIKNLSDRNEYLRESVNKYIDVDEKDNLRFVLQFFYKNNGRNYILGSAIKSIDGKYEYLFENCDVK